MFVQAKEMSEVGRRTSVESPVTSASHSPSDNAHSTSSASIESFLRQTVSHGASDLLLVAGAAPTIFKNGAWISLIDHEMSPDEVVKCVESVLTSEQKKELHERRDLDASIGLAGVGRYRINVHFQKGTLAAAIRTIPTEAPAFKDLGLPEHILWLADFPHGLVLVTGGTGQGKSTTLASLINHVNHTRPAHVITIEDPIEFEFRHDRCLIEQRQIGDDTPSFASALRHVLRQRPDVILIGELRDLETISTALTAAETGHLVFASLHTGNATQTIARIIDVFPAGQQPQVRTQLAASLQAIVCQRLVRDAANGIQVPVTELLFPTSAIRRAMRDNEPHLIYSMIETGRSFGMHTMEQALAGLVQMGRLTPEEAVAAAPNPGALEKLIGQPDPKAVRPRESGKPVGTPQAVVAGRGRPSEKIPWGE